MSAERPAATTPRNLSHCYECDQPFPEPVSEETALDYFTEVEDAGFACEACADREGYPNV